MIEIRNLTKTFGSFTAVDGITFDVKPGEVLGFLGPNGAGKSTTMKMVTGFLPPTSGTAIVCGHDVVRDPMAVKRALGYLPEGAPLYPDMTPLSLLRFVAATRGLKGAKAKEAIDRAVDRVRLQSVLHQRIETLSKGFKRRVGLAQAILHEPKVLILDEPTDGLDPNQKEQVRELIGEMSKERVVLLSTHILEEVEAVCTRAIVIARGKLLFDGTPAEFAERSPYHGAISLTLVGVESARVSQQLGGLPGVLRVEAGTNGTDGQANFMILPSGNAKILPVVARTVHDANWEVDHMSVERGRLDKVFREITLGTPRVGSGPSAAKVEAGR